MAEQPTSGLPLVNQKSLRELGVMLVRDAGLHEGLYDISFEIQVVIGTMAPGPSDPLPGALVGIKSVGLLRAEKAAPHTVDAAQVNPAAPKVKTKARDFAAVGVKGGKR